MPELPVSDALLAWIETAGCEYFLEPVDGVDTLAFGPSLANGDAHWLVAYAPEGHVNVTLIDERAGRGHWRAGFRSSDIAERWLTAEVGFALREHHGYEPLFIPSAEASNAPGVVLHSRDDSAGRTLTDLEIDGTVVGWFARVWGAGNAAYASHILPHSAGELRELFATPRADDRFRTPPSLDPSTSPEGQS